MSQKLAFYILFLSSFWVSAQNEQLAMDYFDKGEFQKALTLFEEISNKQPSNYFFFQKIVECYQQIQQFEKAENAIIKRKEKYNQPILFIELGFNYQLQKDIDKSEKNYKLAIQETENEPNYAYQIANTFEKKGLLTWALKTYETAQKKNPNLNFDYQTAMIQGQLGNLEIMLIKLLDYGFNTPEGTSMVQNQLNRFLIDDIDGSFTALTRKNLLLKTQKSQDVYWNQFLSWFFVQQKEYGKAFIQEKAVYKRNPETIYNIIVLGKLAIEENQDEDAKTIFQFILDNSTDPQLHLEAYDFLLDFRIKNSNPNEYQEIYNSLKSILAKYHQNPFLTKIVLLTAKFEAFYLNNSEAAKNRLNDYLSYSLNIRDRSKIKMELADIMVYDEKFNQAILYYAQVEDNLKNDVLAHEASLKLAKANFYKKDFDWTLQQVKVLKQSPSLLIANDAIEMFLLIQDNSAEDSLRTALQSYATADLKLYQNKKEEALQLFLTILQKHKGESIEEGTLFKVGKIYEEKDDFNKALTYYQNILDNHKDGIYKDEALYFSAEIYRKHFGENEKAKALYEKVVLEHPDSLYFTESRKQYRTLRGDSTI